VPKRATTRTSRRAWIASLKSSCEDNVLLRRLLFVAFFVEVGLLLIVLPWSTFWERNYFAYAMPMLHPLLTNNFVRGAISGLGVLNLLAGLAELAPVFTPRE
jgi:hypothetical protein